MDNDVVTPPADPTQEASLPSTTTMPDAVASQTVTVPQSVTEPNNSVEPEIVTTPPVIIPAIPVPETNDIPKTMPPAGSSPKKQNRIVPFILILIVVTAIAGLVGWYSYEMGKKSAKPAPASNNAMAMAVPQGATIIEQCEPGLGTQYVLPKDIPGGPVYNVYKGKLIGIEYMVSSKSIQAVNTSINNLTLFKQSYDHVNIMSMSAHAGFPEPHFQVDVMMVPPSVSSQITCGTGSSSPSSMSNMSM